ncbi:MAG: glycosyltransferase [Acetatifactor sp.]|nr:glycosyltransferase [Acetatifactor sp.]
MKKDLVSIVIPVYNGSDYVCEAVESALNQTYENIEVIVVNDGSDDEGMTRQCLEPYFERIMYLEKDNGGVASALNEGIKHMNGEYFVWLSHDDLLEKDKVQLQYEALQNCDSEITISAMNYTFFDERTGEVVKTQFHKDFPIERIENSVFLLLWEEVHFSSFMFHKSNFDRIGLFNEELKTAQDVEFIFRLLYRKKIVFLSEPGSRVRLHDRSGTAMYFDEVSNENLVVYQYIRDKLSDADLCEIGGEQTKHKLDAIIAALKSEELDYFTDCKESNIVLVGAGVYGRRLNYELRANGIAPAAFLDNDNKKNNRIIGGTSCRLLRKENIPNHATIVVTTKVFNTLEKQLRDMGFVKIYKRTEIESMMLNNEIESFLGR